MKQFGLAFTAACLAFIIVGCGTAEDNDDLGTIDDPDTGDINQEDDDTTEDDMAEEGAGNWYQELTFKDFELDVEYNHGDYEVEYEYNNGNPEAEIDDTRQGETISMEGQEALEELESPLTSLEITSDMNHEEVIDATIEAFDLEEDYLEFEIEVEYFDDTEAEVEDE
ncbi:YusW family protein [Alteribacter populi]|uniref:YusW family protein n=1 Tax=Alteribacter populi TaxID=2011011 RepID=UPI000BBB5279|nr:YusW family protein [Alteribacter populi]